MLALNKEGGRAEGGSGNGASVAKICMGICKIY